MRTPDPTDPRELVWLALFAFVTLGSGVFLYEVPVDAFVYCFGIWSVILYLVGPVEILDRLGLRSSEEHDPAGTVE